MRKLKIPKGKILFFLIIILGVIVLFGNRTFWRLIKAYQEVSKLNLKIKELEQANKNLEKDIYNLEKDTSTIERIAREELGLIKPGETEYRFLPPKDKK